MHRGVVVHRGYPRIQGRTKRVVLGSCQSIDVLPVPWMSVMVWLPVHASRVAVAASGAAVADVLDNIPVVRAGQHVAASLAEGIALADRVRHPDGHGRAGSGVQIYAVVDGIAVAQHRAVAH